MSLEKTYQTEYINDLNLFAFNSIGPNGIIQKVVLFQEEEKNRYNLALLEEKNGEYLDNITSNNQDFVKIISTVIQTVLIFTENNRNAVIMIKASDKKRLRVYNSIIKRHYNTLSKELLFFGVVKNKGEPYDISKSYDWFVLKRKKE